MPVKSPRRASEERKSAKCKEEHATDLSLPDDLSPLSDKAYIVASLGRLLVNDAKLQDHVESEDLHTRESRVQFVLHVSALAQVWLWERHVQYAIEPGSEMRTPHLARGLLQTIRPQSSKQQGIPPRMG